MVTQQTLPLFDSDPRPSRVRRPRRGSEPQPVVDEFALTGTDFTAQTPQSVSRPADRRQEINPHLLAAKKLSRKIRKLPDHSDIQTRTGQAICQHLRLMLNEMPAASEPDSRHTQSH